MSIVEISDISVAAPDGGRLLGRRIDAPTAGFQGDTYAFRITGWVLSRLAQVETIEVVHDERVIRQSVCGVSRPALAERYPDVPWAEWSGFWTWVGVLSMPPEFRVVLRAVLSDGTRFPLATIRGRHQPVHSSYQPTIQPLMVTSLGRTGTTWLMRVLAEHPRIVAHRRYPYEMRVARYWMHTLKVLSDPANHQQSVGPDNFHANPFRIGHNPFYSVQMAEHRSLGEWFGRTQIEQLAAFCQQSVEGCYREVAASQGQEAPAFFAEKHLPDHLPWMTWEAYPRAREIVLVRDFRDMVCSMLAFNAKRGYASFGRERVQDDDQFIRQLGYSARRLLETWKSRIDRAHLLRYEDMVLQPVETFTRVLGYLELEASPSIIERMLERASLDTHELQSHRTSSDPKASIGRWRAATPAIRSLCQETFGDVLGELGYIDAAPDPSPELADGLRSVDAAACLDRE